MGNHHSPANQHNVWRHQNLPELQDFFQDRWDEVTHGAKNGGLFYEMMGPSIPYIDIWAVFTFQKVIFLNYHFFVAVFLGCTSTGRVGLCFLWFYVQELRKAQPAVILVLKRLRRQGNSLKSHPTDWEKPGIDPATPGLQINSGNNVGT